MKNSQDAIPSRPLLNPLIAGAAFYLLSQSAGFSAITSLYDYFSALPSPVPAQTGDEEWTFHYGDQDAVLITPYAGSPEYYGYNTSIAATFGGAAIAGGSPDGTAGTNEAPGIFVHTASDRPMTAVYHFDSNQVIPALSVSHELVTNGNQGNGIDLTLRLIRGGNVSDVGTISIVNFTNQETIIPIPSASQSFESGDRLALVFDARGSYLFDHGWVDIATAVPEPSSGLLFGLAGLGMMSLSRRRK